MSLQRVLVRELGHEQAGQVLMAIALDEARASLPAVDPSYWVWRSGWRYLSRLKPEAFAIEPATIQPFRALQVAFSYGLKSEPRQVHPLRLHREEAESLRHGRELLRTWTRLRSFSRPCSAFLIRDASSVGAAFAFPRFADVMALSMDRFRGLRRHIALREHALAARRSCDSPRAAVASLVLHEEMHVALGVACGRRTRDHRPLLRLLEEVTALTAEAAVHEHLSGTGRQSTQLVAAAELLSMGAHASAEEITGALVRLCVAPGADDHKATALLNRASGRRLTTRGWQRRLISDFALS